LDSLDISSCPELKELYCGNNKLTFIDVTNNPDLEWLSCGRCLYPLFCLLDGFPFTNKIENIDLSQNPQLIYFGCADCSLSNLDISDNKKLKYLRLSDMPTLEEVCVWDTFLSDSVEVDTLSSPSICFETDCNGVCGTTGVDRTPFREFSIYPNPTNSIFTIETTNSGLHNIEITSLNGQLLYRTQMEGTTHQINLSSFQKGIYFITLKSRNYVRIEKIIKQ